jgi:hypothetical protein
MISKQYLAGFIDGEGYISVVKHKDSRTARGFTLHPIINISGSDKEVLNQLNNVVNGKIRTKQKQYGCKQVYDIQLQDLEGIKALLKSIIPYLLIKSKQATLMKEFVELRLRNRNKGYTDRELEIAEIFRTINKRGESQNA